MLFLHGYRKAEMGLVTDFAYGEQTLTSQLFVRKNFNAPAHPLGAEVLCGLRAKTRGQMNRTGVVKRPEIQQ